MRLSRLVVADLTDPSSVPHERATVVPGLRRTPVLLLRAAGDAGCSIASDRAARSPVMPPLAGASTLRAAPAPALREALSRGARLRGG